MKNKKFYFSLFLSAFLLLMSAWSCDDVSEYDPCRSDSWTLYRNEYEDTIIVVDPYK